MPHFIVPSVLKLNVVMLNVTAPSKAAFLAKYNASCKGGASSTWAHYAENTEGRSITVRLTCLTGLESAVSQLKIFVFICKTG
jgi:hypothetical protein